LVIFLLLLGEVYYLYSLNSWMIFYGVEEVLMGGREEKGGYD
jgi:hypothetical protein